MSSGESPPTYYFSGITCNPDFYTGTTGTYLTATTGKKHFLSYPTAQGTETISTLYSSQIDSVSGSTAFNFLESQTANLNIGENTTGTVGQIIKIGAPALTTVKLGAISVKESTIETLAPSTAFNFLASQTANLNIGNTTTGTSGQVIKIGPTATTTIQVGDISVSGSSINNATNASTRSVKIGDGQTDAAADLNLGTHINRLGEINIGTGNSTAAPTINIGATLLNGSVRAGAIINIGRMTTNAITIGNASADVNIYCSTGSIKTGAFACTTQTASGLITANNGITIPSGKTLIANGGIEVGSNSTIFTTSGQQLRLGYANTQSTGSTSSSFGPFFKSFGPASISGTTYDIILTGSSDAIFTPTSVDGVGGLLTIVMKNTVTPAKCATYIYNVMKRTGITGINSIFSISLQAGGWTTANPTLGQTGVNDNLRITFNAADVTGTTVSWLFMGSI
jgi:hypothetical protein